MLYTGVGLLWFAVLALEDTPTSRPIVYVEPVQASSAIETKSTTTSLPDDRFRLASRGRPSGYYQKSEPESQASLQLIQPRLELCYTRLDFKEWVVIPCLRFGRLCETFFVIARSARSNLGQGWAT